MAVILYPIVTEKAISMIELENKIVFVVSSDATKPEIKKEVEEKFQVKVDSVNVQNTMKGKKKAYVKINSKFKADQIASKLKIA